MVLPILGAALGAGASLIGGAMNRSAQNKANEQNYQAQKEFAKNGLRWKVDDAKKAGIHPLYAVGAPTQSFSASYVGDTSMGNALQSAGQDIGGAIRNTQPVNERVETFNEQMMTLQLERGTLENELLRSQIRRSLVGSNPSFPSTNGSGASGDVLTSENAGAMVSSPIFPNVTVNDHTPAQTVSDEYGDWVGDSHGFMRYLDTVLPVLPSGSSGRSYDPRQRRLDRLNRPSDVDLGRPSGGGFQRPPRY